MTLSLSQKKTTVAYMLSPLFFVSGFAALIYQVCWQRILFGSFGVDLDSVTIIVSVFMLGLGFGALFGGLLADCFPESTAYIFAGAEFFIGVFGWFSPGLMRILGEVFIHSSQAVVAIINFLALLIPTSFMGATLPVLVSHVTRRWQNVGKSIGFLYKVNTLGAAFGVLFVVFFWFLLFNIDSAIHFAAVSNLMVSVCTLLWIRNDV
jgi:predicted membrane-bound spermidine synthase